MSDIKSRYWVGIIYPESLAVPVEEWGDIIQKPYAYCLHDKDLDGHGGDRKAHYHLIIVWNNNTTYKAALRVFQKLMPTCAKIEECDIRHMYDYLIHDTEACRKAGKHLYDKSERICCNNFDIDLYEKTSLEEKQMYRRELASYLLENNFYNYTDFYSSVLLNYESVYEEVACLYTNFFSSLCKGNYLKNVVIHNQNL